MAGTASARRRDRLDASARPVRQRRLRASTACTSSHSTCCTTSAAQRLTRRTIELLLELARDVPPRGTHRGALRRRARQCHRAPRGDAHGAAQPLRTGRCSSTDATSCRRYATSSARMRELRHRRTRGPDHRPSRRPLHRRRQYRDRRLRPRHRHGHGGAGSISESRDPPALRLQRRRGGALRGARAGRPGAPRCSWSARRPSRRWRH